MNKRRKQRKRPQGGKKSGPSGSPRAPTVHVEVVHLGGKLDGVDLLVKPALLYADRVTVYSPVAQMFRSVEGLASISDPRQQIEAILQISSGVPPLESPLDADPQTLSQLRMFLKADPRIVRVLARKMGTGGREIEGLYEKLGEVSAIWEKQMPDAVAKAKAATGGGELHVAVEAGAVEIADLTGASSSRLLRDSIRAALGSRSGESMDELMVAYVTRTAEILTAGKTFPLLDAASSDLVRAMEREAVIEPSTYAARRGSEIGAATRFMGFLPHFPDLPMDEVLDLRNELRGPLVGFRSAMGELTRDFASRSFDDEFALEVADAWRHRVEPALVEIREALAEHGLLREVASVALGDPRRILVEAGGVVAAGHGDLLSISEMMTAALATGIPIADVLGRAILNTRKARRHVRRNGFYFLHQLSTEAASRRAG